VKPVDDDVRERLRRDHATSFVLEAGAGTGKTTLIVDRVVALVTSGDARLEEVAAVTFTENAAATLKLRLREALELCRADAARGEAERERAAAALEALESAPVTTIHALCAALLAERPLECGVVPGFRVADDAEMDRFFAQAWDEWLAEHLVAGDPALLEALDDGIPLANDFIYAQRSSLRGLCRALVEQRDLEPLVAAAAPDPAAWHAELLARLLHALPHAGAAKSADALAAHLLDLAERARGLEGLDGPALARALLDLPEPKVQGDKRNWPSAEALEAGRGFTRWWRDSRAAWIAGDGAARHGRLIALSRDVVRRYEQRKQAAGALDFLDLLVKARDALVRHEGVRAYFKGRFRFVIIDEFQDTDPLQVEIAEALTGGEPGRLTIVGDPKQSIYRFRRAEVTLFERLRERADGQPGHAVARLSQNFRSRPAIVRFVNRTFEKLLQRSEEAGQPAYAPIAPRADLGDGPAVLALRFEAFAEMGQDLLAAEARVAASFAAHVARGGYPVRDGALGERPSRAGDLLVLARRFTQLRSLEEALEAAGIAFAVEGGKSFFDRAEVHEARAVLQAVDDPSDRVALVAALRSAFFGVSDRDLVAYALAAGAAFSLLVEPDPGQDGGPAVAPALGLLRELHGRRRHDSVAQLLETLYDRTRVQAALHGTRRGGSRIANLDKVVALARDAARSGVPTLRGFLALLDERIAAAREEPDLPETRPGDPDTARVLSIHRAKGLEAPIVLLHDVADRGGVRNDTIALWGRREVAIGFRAGCQPPGWDALRREDERRGLAENRRLLYVACTRARDFLAIPDPRGAETGDFWKPLLDALPSKSDPDVDVVDVDTLPAPETRARARGLRAVAAPGGGDAVAARWEQERDALLEAGRHRDFTPISATARAAREAPPVAAAGGGPGGRDFGGLVHRVLQHLPFADPAAADRARTLATGFAPLCGLGPESAERAARLCAALLAHPLAERVRRSPRVLRELRVWLPEEGELVEGIVDLAFEEEGALVVVDWKTDAITEAQAIDQAAHHAPQLRLYARALTQATGLKVRERLVYFTAVARAVPV
jgi:ATP-dependent helicase/nuclease subunit A